MSASTAREPGNWGTFTHDDGKSRPFGDRTARGVVAEVLAKREGWSEVRPGHWAEAGAIVDSLKSFDWLRTARERTLVTYQSRRA